MGTSVNHVAIGVAIFNLIVVVAGIAVLWGKFSAQFLAVGQTVSAMDAILHPDPAKAEDRIMTVGDCLSFQQTCQQRVCLKIEDISTKVGLLEGKINESEAKRKHSSQKYDERWATIEGLMGSLKEYIDKPGTK